MGIGLQTYKFCVQTNLPPVELTPAKTAFFFMELLATGIRNTLGIDILFPIK